MNRNQRYAPIALHDEISHRIEWVANVRHISYRTRSRSNAAMKRDTERNGASLGVRYCSPVDLVADMWGLYGDGRSIIDPLSRRIIVSSLLAEFGLQVSLGTVDLVSKMVERVPCSKVEGHETASSSLSDKKLLKLMHEYHRMIEDRGLVELADVVDKMSAAEVVIDMDRAEPLLLDEPLVRLFGRDDPTDHTDVDVVEIPDIRLLLSRGPSARSSMMIEDIEQTSASDAHDSIAVVCNEPLSFFERLLGRNGLSDRVDVRLIASVPVSDSELGRMLAAMKGMMDANSREAFIAFASDLVMSPYIDMKPFSMDDLRLDGGASVAKGCGTEGRDETLRNLSKFDLNTIWRRDRTLDEARILAQIRKLSASFGPLLDLMVGASDDISIFDVLSANASSRHGSYLLDIELSAIAKAKQIFEARGSLGVGSALMLDMVLCARSSFGIASASGATCRITVMDHSSATDMLPDSFDVLYLDDVSSDSFNSKEQRSSVDILLEELGYGYAPSRSQVVSSEFDSIVSSASKLLVMCHSLRNDAGEENFVSFVFDDLISRYTDGEADTDNVIGRFSKGAEVALSNGRRIDVRIAGEERFQSGIGASSGDPVDVLDIPFVRRGSLLNTDASELVRSIDPDGSKRPILSASAIEAYMGCPYRWFLERRLKLDSVDDGISAMDVGSFLHRVLELFFKAVLEDDVAKGKLYKRSDEWIDETLDPIYEKVLSEQASLSPDEARYIPVTEVELAQDALRRRALSNSIKLMRGLPHDSSCAQLELSFDPEKCVEAGVSYAGAYMNGKIDRIDISDDGSDFFVIDYKGSIKDHSAGSGCFELVETDSSTDEASYVLDPEVYPDHVQVIIYSTMYERFREAMGLGGRCVGSFYVSYKNKGHGLELSGSYPSSDPRFSSIADKASIVNMDLGEFFDAVERLIAVHVEGLMSGAIPLSPHSGNACAHCLYRDCEARL